MFFNIIPNMGLDLGFEQTILRYSWKSAFLNLRTKQKENQIGSPLISLVFQITAHCHT